MKNNYCFVPGYIGQGILKGYHSWGKMDVDCYNWLHFDGGSIDMMSYIHVEVNLMTHYNHIGCQFGRNSYRNWIGFLTDFDHGRRVCYQG